MLSNFIKKNINFIKKLVIIMHSLTSFYLLIFAININLVEKILFIIVGTLMIFIAFSGVKFILWVQWKNPLCPKKVLNLFCNFFIIFSVIGFLGVFLYISISREIVGLFILGSLEGIIFASVYTKMKYIFENDERESIK